VKRPESPEVNVHEPLVAEVVDEMLADRFDSAQGRSIEKRGDVFGTAARSVDVDLVIGEFFCL